MPESGIFSPLSPIFPDPSQTLSFYAPTYVFSDLKVKDFAIDPRTGKPIFTFTGSLDRNDLLNLASHLDARGRHNTAEGLRRIAEKYGSMEVSELAIGPDGQLLHLHGQAGGEVRSYDLYHDKDLTYLEKWRRGEIALSAATEEGRETMEWLKKQAEAKGWRNTAAFLADLLAHPEKSAFLKWTTDSKGNLATLEVKRGGKFENLDAGIRDRSITDKGDYRVVEDTINAGTREGYRKLEKLIEDAEKNPKLRNVAHKLGEALVWGDSFSYRAKYDKNGNLVNIEVEQGGRWRDLDKVELDHTAHGKYLVPVKDKDGKVHYELVEGTLVYNEALQQWEVVAGNVAYGIHGRVIRYFPPDPRTGRPGGLVFADVQWDPRTGRIVSGKESSVLVKEGEIEVAGLKMHGYMAYDTRTGTRLFVDAKTGKFYTYTPYGEHWKELRGWQGQGSYLLSALHEGVEIIGGEKAARLVTQVTADTAKGLDEIAKTAQVITTIKGMRSKQPPSPKETGYEIKAGESTVLGPDGKPASTYEGLVTRPRERIFYR